MLFLTLVVDIGPRFKEPWSRLPRRLRRRIERSFGLTPAGRRRYLISPPWDNLTPAQRHAMAAQWDAQFNPDLSRARAEADFLEGFGKRPPPVPAGGAVLERPKAGGEATSTRTALGLATKESRLAELRQAPAKDDAPAVALQAVRPRRRPGRPQEWDWPGAMADLAAMTATTGLPVVQANAERMVEKYFADRNDGNSPVIGRIRDHVSPVYQAAAAKRKSKREQPRKSTGRL